MATAAHDEEVGVGGLVDEDLRRMALGHLLDDGQLGVGRADRPEGLGEDLAGVAVGS